MPGIVGLITKMPGERAKEELSRMLGVMCHEPFYVSGMWTDESLGIYVGWIARENTFADKMPLRNDRGDVVMVFSGEDHPASDAVRIPESQDHTIDGGPAYLVRGYEQDPGFLKSLNGRFHGLIVDRRNGTATLFNDRFGLERMYYHQAKEAFYFSAEAKAILAVRPDLRSMDCAGLAEFISCGCVLQNRTLFQGIYVLPRASEWRFRAGALEQKGTYFDPREWEEQDPLDPEGYYRELRDAFTSALPRYFQGRERVGMSLTGGLDTRAIMAWTKAAPGSLPCYTFGSMYRENQDVYLARRVANICRQPYHLIDVDRDCMAKFPQHAERTLYLTDGCIDVSRGPDLYNNQMARQIAPARMIGVFGSEIIRGAIMFKHVPPMADIYQAELANEISRAGTTYQDQFQKNKTTFAVFHQPSVYLFGSLRLEESQLTMRTPFLDNDIVRTVFRAPRTASSEDVRLRLVREGSPELARLRTDRGLGDANPISSFLRRAYLEFTFKAEYAYDVGMPQWVAQVDHAFAPLHLERLWLGRHKPFHFRYWYRTILAEYVQEVLLDPRSLARPYVKREEVEAMVEGHLKGTRNYTQDIHRLLSLELLHRMFIDSFQAPKYV